MRRLPRILVRRLRQAAAATLALLALVLALRPPPDDARPQPDEQPVVVAATDLPAGRSLTAADLVVARLPDDAVPDGVAAAPAPLTGSVLAAPVRRGEPVTDVRLVGPRLWAQVPAGQVAAPVRLADLAVVGLLRAGDRVDVLATGSPDVDAGAGAADGAQVVAADALVLTATGPDDDGPATAAADGGLLVLAVDPGTAARLAAAAAGATLTVTLGRP